jgi:hypothetical protein
MPAKDNLPELITAWQNGGISAANALACSLTPGCSTGLSAANAAARNFTLDGSNGWAIGPTKRRVGQRHFDG